ncbi:hypothetical protein [Nocardia sp. NPDC049526]|uniref:hypothetical protein n=1 Tax=Nocardia sp. NPDC049526 TaxID=3364316 RepID=UPI0037A07D8B
MTIRGINDIDRFDHDDIDAVVHLRSVRRCHLERSGLDSVTVAVHLLAETGDLPGWDDALDIDCDDESDWEWAA